MPTFSNIAGQEPSTVTFRVATVVIPRGSTNEQQEILCLGDPNSSNGIAQISNTTPSTSSWGLHVRPVDVTPVSGTFKTVYPAAPTTITIAPENVASSSTFVAGVESDVISNVSNLDVDILISGKWTSGTTPTANTQVQIWVIPSLTDDLAGTRTWPDVFDGTASAETVTSAGVLQGLGRLGAVLNVDTNTTGREYACAAFSVAALFGGVLPPSFVLFIAHNTGVNSNTTAGNHAWSYQRVQMKAA